MLILEDLTVFFTGMYNRDQSCLNYLFESHAPKYIYTRMYDKMVRLYGLTPIENLEEEEKKQLVSECRSTGIFFTNKTLIEAAKTLHVIKFLNNK